MTGTDAASQPVLRAAVAADAAALARMHVDSWRETYAGIVPQAHLDGLSYDDRAARWAESFATADAPWRTFVLETAEGMQGFATAGAARAPLEIHLRPKGAARAPLEFLSPAGAADAGEIYAIYMLRAAQGRGWGKRLFRQAQCHLAEAGFRDMYLWVLADNPSRGFYRHMGGVEIGRKMLNIGGQDLEEIAMAWKGDGT